MLAVVVNAGYLLLSRSYNESARPVVAAKKIEWIAASLQQISPPGTNAFYPRMIQLSDGGLLLAYASQGNIIVQKSFDRGQHWQPSIIAAEKEDGVNMDTPELLQLFNGEVLLSYNGRPQGALKNTPETGKRFDIRIKKTSDKGLSWNNTKTLYAAGESFKDGCWEPAAIQLPNGVIQLFFSDEGIYTNSNEQNISMLSSADNGANWSAQPKIISFRNNSRDGMPVPVWLPAQKEIAIAIEDPGIKNFKPVIIRSSANGTWDRVINGSDAQRSFALEDKIADTVYAGAPYLRRLSNAVTILSYQSTEDRIGKNTDANAVMIVATGDEDATGFTNKTIPFAIPQGYHALWNSLCIIKNDTIIALTSTNGFSKSASEVWMIKGVLK